MTLFNKIKWVLGILLVFGLILATNLIDRQHFNAINDSVESIYADRLVAQHIIYEMSATLYEKQLAYLNAAGAPGARQQVLNERLRNNVERFATTKLTSRETEIFNRLRQDVDRLERGESESQAAQISRIDEVKGHLDDLSEVQLTEGNREVHKSKKAIGSANFFTQLEIAILIVLAIVIQVVVIYDPMSRT
jgi:hypothetical protein